jgi:hypothetical protein
VRLGLLIFVAVLVVAVGSWFVYREFGAPSFRRYERRFSGSVRGALGVDSTCASRLFYFSFLRPFFTFGRILRVCSISLSVQSLTLTPPTLCTLGAWNLFAAKYRCSVIRLIPSFFAACRVE